VTDGASSVAQPELIVSPFHTNGPNAIVGASATSQPAGAVAAIGEVGQGKPQPRVPLVRCDAQAGFAHPPRRLRRTAIESKA